MANLSRHHLSFTAGLAFGMGLMHLMYALQMQSQAPALNEPLEKGDSVLDEIINFQQLFHSSDKTFRHGYHWFYGRHLPRYRSKEDLPYLRLAAT